MPQSSQSLTETTQTTPTTEPAQIRPTETLRRSTPIQMAQAETGANGQTPGETHAETRAGSEAETHSAGEIPSATLLFANSLLVAVGLILFAVVARRTLAKVPRGFGNFAEYVAEAMNTFTTSIIGAEGKKYTPFIGTIFLYVLLANLMGLIPFLHSPTTNISITLALGVIVFVYVQIEGVRNNGAGGHIMHFMGPKLGKYPLMAPLMFPVELISECVKPFTLAVRLFGNIFGEDVILIVLAGLLTTLGLKSFGWLPVQFPVVMLAVLTAGVQAFVFAMLACIYLSLVAHHEHEHDQDDHDPAQGLHAMTDANEAGF